MDQAFVILAMRGDSQCSCHNNVQAMRANTTSTHRSPSHELAYKYGTLDAGYTIQCGLDRVANRLQVLFARLTLNVGTQFQLGLRKNRKAAAQCKCRTSSITKVGLVSYLCFSVPSASARTPLVIRLWSLRILSVAQARPKCSTFAQSFFKTHLERHDGWT
jgi:hypothetical protein